MTALAHGASAAEAGEATVEGAASSVTGVTAARAAVSGRPAEAAISGLQDGAGFIPIAGPLVATAVGELGRPVARALGADVDPSMSETAAAANAELLARQYSGRELAAHLVRGNEDPVYKQLAQQFGNEYAHQVEHFHGNLPAGMAHNADQYIAQRMAKMVSDAGAAGAAMPSGIIRLETKDCPQDQTAFSPTPSAPRGPRIQVATR